MKVTIVVFAITAFAAVKAFHLRHCDLSNIQQEALKFIQNYCNKNSGVGETALDQIHAGNFNDEDVKLVDYVFCMFKKIDLITDEGKFKKDVALSKFPKGVDLSAVEEAIDACILPIGDNPQISTFLMAKCLNGKVPFISLL